MKDESERPAVARCGFNSRFGLIHPSSFILPPSASPLPVPAPPNGAARLDAPGPGRVVEDQAALDRAAAPVVDVEAVLPAVADLAVADQRVAALPDLHPGLPVAADHAVLQHPATLLVD